METEIIPCKKCGSLPSVAAYKFDTELRKEYFCVCEMMVEVEDRSVAEWNAKQKTGATLLLPPNIREILLHAIMDEIESQHRSGMLVSHLVPHRIADRCADMLEKEMSKEKIS